MSYVSDGGLQSTVLWFCVDFQGMPWTRRVSLQSIHHLDTIIKLITMNN